MPDGLVISGGGETTSVETLELHDVAAQLGGLSRDAGALAADLGGLEGMLGSTALAGAPLSARRALAEADRAMSLLHQAHLQTQVLAWALSYAADGYGTVESLARQLVGGAVDGLGSLVGMLAPAFLPGMVLTAAGFAALSPADRNRMLSDPRLAAAVRAGVAGTDDAILARAGIPAPLAALLGERGMGLTGLPFAAGAVAGLGGVLGAFSPGPVRVAREHPLPTADAPGGFAERLQRIPDPERLDGAQVTIEKYEMPDGTIRAEVYIAGTVDFDPWAEGEPWDMGSNMLNAVGPGSGSYEGVLAAMAEAGIDSETPVQFTGYSQGGGTAARLAASGDFDVRGLVTFGGPTGQIPVPESVPSIIVEHTDDLVAALGGPQENEHAVIVQRHATVGMNFEGSELMPGHRMPAYLETARLMDDEQDGRLAGAAAGITGFTSGGVLVSRVAYECERVSDASPSAGAAGFR